MHVLFTHNFLTILMPGCGRVVSALLRCGSILSLYSVSWAIITWLSSFLSKSKHSWCSPNLKARLGHGYLADGPSSFQVIVMDNTFHILFDSKHELLRMVSLFWKFFLIFSWHAKPSSHHLRQCDTGKKSWHSLRKHSFRQGMTSRGNQIPSLKFYHNRILNCPINETIA